MKLNDYIAKGWKSTKLPEEGRPRWVVRNPHGMAWGTIEREPRGEDNIDRWVATRHGMRTTGFPTFNSAFKFIIEGA